MRVSQNKEFTTARVGKVSCSVKYNLGSMGVLISLVHHLDNGKAEFVLEGGETRKLVEHGSIEPTQYFARLGYEELHALAEALMDYVGKKDVPQPINLNESHAKDLKDVAMTLMKKIPDRAK